MKYFYTTLFTILYMFSSIGCMDTNQIHKYVYSHNEHILVYTDDEDGAFSGDGSGSGIGIEDNYTEPSKSTPEQPNNVTGNIIKNVPVPVPKTTFGSTETDDEDYAFFGDGSGYENGVDMEETYTKPSHDIIQKTVVETNEKYFTSSGPSGYTTEQTENVSGYINTKTSTDIADAGVVNNTTSYPVDSFTYAWDYAREVTENVGDINGELIILLKAQKTKCTLFKNHNSSNFVIYC